MLIKFLSTWVKAGREEAQAPPATALLPAGFAEAWALYRAGLREDAQRAAAQLLATDPRNVEALLVCGSLALDQGDVVQGQRLLDKAPRGTSADALLLTALGRACLAAGRQAAARERLEQALKLAPDSAEPRLHLALLAIRLGQVDKARDLLLAAVALEPGLADARFHLGNIQLAREDFDGAMDHYHAALVAEESHADAHANLGALLKRLGRADEACAHLERALQLRPDLAQASFNLAMLRIQQDQWDTAAVLLRGSLQSQPRQADALLWLGNALMRQGDATAARESYRAAAALDGKFVAARWGLVMAQLPAVPQTVAEQQEGVQSFAKELKKFQGWLTVHQPNDAHSAVGAQQPFYLAYDAHNNREVLGTYGALCARLMAGWAARSGLAAPAVTGRAKCKLGIASAHVGDHSVWHALVRGWLQHLDPARFELHLLHLGGRSSDQLQWAAQRVKAVHQRSGDWADWAGHVAAERFDALLYPEIGMDATTARLSALRLAPLQLASWGHPITTGLPTMDGFVSAAAFEPADAQAHYTEPLLTLPRLGCCYQPFGTAAAAVDLAGWGVRPQDRVLVCAGTPFKYAPEGDAWLVDIARRCRPCKLVFFRARPDALSGLLEQRLRRAFEQAGESFDESVCFIPWQSQAEFFGVLDRAHVLLDSPDFSGFNTTMQALERRLPVVAWEGEFMRGRFASGILREAGLAQWVAGTAGEYVDRVRQLCDDAALRDHLRQQLARRSQSLLDDRDCILALGNRLLALS